MKINNLKKKLFRQKLDMLLDVLKEENSFSQNGDELSRTLNDTAASVTTPPATDNNSSNAKTTIGKTEKDKYNTKERQNSCYFVRNGDKEAIQSRANSLKRAINSVMEHSGLYDHKPRHGFRDRKLSLTALNISDTPNLSPVLPPINIISPSSSQTQLSAVGAVVTCLSPLPDQRRSSMDEYFFSSLNLPVPKQFADAASRRSSDIPEVIKEEESNEGPTSSDFKYEKLTKIEYNYDVGYLGLNSFVQNENSRCVPYEVFERNLLRSTHQSNVEVSVNNKSEVINQKSQCAGSNRGCNSLQVPVIPLSELEMMERSLLATENVYISDNMTIIDIDPVVSFILIYSFYMSNTFLYFFKKKCK